MKLVIRGILTTAGHIHQTSPDSKGEQLKSNIAVNGQLVRGLPYISANSVRGMIRRGAAEHVIQQIAKEKQQISRNLYLSIVRGSFGRTQIDPSGATYTEAAGAAKHVFAGLFGGGARMFRSPLRVCRDLFPVLTETAAVMPVEVREHALAASPRDILAKVLMAPRDDFARLPSGAQSVVEDVMSIYVEHMAIKKAQREEAKDGESKDDLDNFTQSECIIPGVPLLFDVATEDITEAQAGMLLKGLHTWVNRNALGGGSARGRGAFIPSLAMWVDGQKLTDNLFAGDAPWMVLSSHETVQRCVDACNAELQDNLRDGLASAYPSEVPKEDKSQKGSKGKKSDITTESELPGAA